MLLLQLKHGFPSFISVFADVYKYVNFIFTLVLFMFKGFMRYFIPVQTFHLLNTYLVLFLF